MGRTNIVLDDALLDEGLRLSGLGTRRALVHAALERYVAWLRQQRIRALRGQVTFEPGYDHRQGRSSRAAEPRPDQEPPPGPSSTGSRDASPRRKRTTRK